MREIPIIQVLLVTFFVLSSVAVFEVASVHCTYRIGTSCQAMVVLLSSAVGAVSTHLHSAQNNEITLGSKTCVFHL